MDPLSKSIRAKIQKFQFYQLRKLQNIETAYFLMGNSRAGKTCLFLLLQNIKLQSIQKNGQIKVDIYNSKKNTSDLINHGICNYIGHGGVSKTKMPNICQLKDTKMHLIDCPGLLDSQGFEDDFTNQYFIMRIFQLVKKARYLLCIQENDLKNDNKVCLQNAISGFFKYFNQKYVNFEQVFKNTSIVITKKSKPKGKLFVSFKDISQSQKQSLKSINISANQYFEKKQLINHKNLFNQIFQNRRFYFFYQPNKTDENIKCDNILEEQKNRQSIFTINFQKDINHNFYTFRGQQKQKMLTFTILQMYKRITQKICQICQIITKVIKQIKQNIKKNKIEQKTYNFRKQIEQYVYKNDIYQLYNQSQQRKLFLQIPNFNLQQTLPQLSEIIFLQNVKKHYQSFQENQIQQLVHHIFIQILKFCYIKANKCLLYEFIYLSKKLFDQLKILKNVIQNHDLLPTFQEPYESIQIKYSFQQVQNQFVQNYQINNEYTDQDAEQLINFFQNNLTSRKSIYYLNLNEKKLKQSILQCLLQQKEQIEKQIEYVQILKKIQMKIIKNVASIYQVIEKHQQAYKYVSSKRKKQLQYHHFLSNYNQFKPNIDLYQYLAKLSIQNLKNYSLGIEYYKVIRYHHSIKKLYNAILKDCHDNKKRYLILKKQALFLEQICEPYEAKKSLQQAFQLSKTDSEKIQILNMINQILMNQNKTKQIYRRNITQQKFYKIPNNNQIEKLQKQSNLI